MPNEVKIKVVADKPDASGFRAVDDELKKTQTEAKATGRSLTDLNDQFKRTGVGADDLGESIKGSSDNMTEADRIGTQHRNTLTSLEDQYKKVNADIATSRGELVKLTRAFADTDDAAQRLDIGKAIDKLNADLRRSTASKKVLVDFSPNLEKGSEGKILSQLKGLGPALGEGVGSPWGLAIAGGMALALGPTLLSAASAAVVGAVGLGGIVGGVALASHNAAVHTAAQELVATFSTAIGRSATKWFQGPILDAIPIARGALTKLAASAEQIFHNLAPYLKPLVTDLGAAANNFGDALVSVSAKAGPAISAIGGSVKLIGAGIGDFLKTISDNGENAGSSLEVVAGGLADILRFSGQVINFFDKVSSNPWFGGGLLPILRARYKAMAGASKDLSDATGDVATSFTNAEKAAMGERDALQGLSAELKAQTDPVFAVITAENNLSKAHKDAAQAAKDHGVKSEEYKTATRDAALAALSLEGAVGKLGTTFNGKLTPEMLATLQAAGLTKAEIKSLEGQFGDAKKAGDDFSKDYVADASVRGVNPAKRQLTELERAARAYAKTWTATMITNFIQTGKPSSSAHYNPSTLSHGLAHGGIKGAASGMVSGDLTWVGEAGPELVSLPTGSTVHSAPDSARMADGGGSDQPIVVVIELDGAQVAKAVIEPLRRNIRQLGAGSVQRYLGQAGAR